VSFKDGQIHPILSMGSEIARDQPEVI
jgi:hypothetical protein